MATDEWWSKGVVFPNDAEYRESVRKRYASDFDCLTAVFDVGRKALFYLQKQETVLPTAIAIAVLTRELRRVRLIAAAAELGQLENIEILTRGVFEGLLAERFVFKSPKRMNACSTELKNARRVLPAYPRRHSAVDFRALLYANYEAIRMNQIASHCPSDDVPAEARTALAKAAGDAECQIGRRWAQIQRKTSYSGIKRVDLRAENYRLEGYYTGVYRVQATRSHANEILGYCNVTSGGDLLGCELLPVEELTRLSACLGISASVFGLLVSDLNRMRDLGLTPECEEAARQARRRADELGIMEE